MEKLEICKIWLLDKLEDSKFLIVSKTKEEASAEGFTRSDLKKARLELNIKTSPLYDIDNSTCEWLWYKALKR